MPRRLSRFVGFVSALLLMSVAVLAQRDLGTITGTVSDPQGAAVANAKVVIIEDATGLSYTAETDASGTYVRPLLKPGTYTVTVEAPGFQKAQQKGIIVTPGARSGANIALSVGNVNQTVEVTSGAPLLQTESAQQGADLNSSQVTQLPLGGQRTFAVSGSPDTWRSASGAGRARCAGRRILGQWSAVDGREQLPAQWRGQ